MELAERAFGVNVFSLHLEGIAGRLPRDALAPRPTASSARGSSTPGAPLVAPDTEDWLDRGVRDVPSPGQRIGAGHPVCTVLARGRDRQACLAGLVSGAAAVYGECERVSEGAVSERLTMIAGRRRGQAAGTHTGKDSPEDSDATARSR